jgi:hypothetical protein
MGNRFAAFYGHRPAVFRIQPGLAVRRTDINAKKHRLCISLYRAYWSLCKRVQSNINLMSFSMEIMKFVIRDSAISRKYERWAERLAFASLLTF